VAGTGRDRVTIDLRGIGDAVRMAARARRTTVADLARTALVEVTGSARVIEPREPFGGEKPLAVKLMLRLPSPDAELLVLHSAALGLSYGSYVARLVRGTPLPALESERTADREALMASVDRLAQLTSDLNALSRLLSQAKAEGVLRYRDSALALVGDVRRHLELASRVIARQGGGP
jgi:hypothetical protein